MSEARMCINTRLAVYTRSRHRLSCSLSLSQRDRIAIAARWSAAAVLLSEGLALFFPLLPRRCSSAMALPQLDIRPFFRMLAYLCHHEE